MLNNAAKHNFGGQSRKETSNIDSKALETIKILGNQVLEMRELMDKQSRAIKALREEIAVLRKQDKGIEAEINILRIDQKDVLSQMKTLKHSQEQTKYQNPKQDDIARRFYPKFDESPLFNNEPEALLSSLVPKKENRDFVFTRIPKLLNLD
jgi:chromosome segregation ATPase